MMTDLTGQQFGNYRLVRLLGTGGFASVYLGQHVRIASQQAAIKILHLFGVDSQAFQQEAETTASLDHPHIVRLLDFDLRQGNMPFLVMYYAPNGSLRSRHAKGMQLPLSTVIQYTREIASALQYAHENNIVHRDLKPENILVGRHNELLLSDFGISVLSKTGRTSLEHGYNIGGTAEYMAPEMFRGKPEKASDQYALGIVVYEWLSGTPPFTEGNPIQLGYQHTHEEIPPLRAKLSSLSPQVEATVLRALAKDPKNRFLSIQAFADALEEASRAPLPASPTVSPPATPSGNGKESYFVQQLRALHEGGPIYRSSPPSPPPGTLLLTYQNHQERVVSVAWSPDGPRVASGSFDGAVRIWDANNGQELLQRSKHDFIVWSVAWSPDGNRVASGAMDKTAKIVDILRENKIIGVGSFTAPVNFVAWSPDGKQLAVASSDKQVTIWEASNGERLLGGFQGHTDGVVCVAWSPDGKQLASCSADKTVQVWEPTRGRLLYKYIGHRDSAFSVVWSPDGSHLASCSADKSVHIWSARNGRLLYKYSGHTASVSRVAWSPDGKWIASGSHDKTIQVWEAYSGKHHYTYTGHTDAPCGLTWSPDSKCLASTSMDTTVHVWQAL